MEKIAKLKELLASAEADAEKFYNKRNSAAGTRLRGIMQQLKVAAQEIRNEVTETKNAATK
jgi:outer membrane protein assembly factor BamD (BamD/ComL family)